MSIVVILGAEQLVVPHHALHADEIDDALELLLGPDRQLDRHRLGAQAVDDVLEALEEVRADLVHLVGRRRCAGPCTCRPGARPSRSAARRPGCCRARTPRRRARASERSTSMVKSTWPGVSMMLSRFLSPSPERRGRGRGDRDAALLLLLHEVHGRGAFVHLADLVALAGVIEDPLGRRRLAGIDVGHDAEVAVVLDRMSAGHGN